MFRLERNSRVTGVSTLPDHPDPARKSTRPPTLGA